MCSYDVVFDPGRVYRVCKSSVYTAYVPLKGFARYVNLLSPTSYWRLKGVVGYVSLGEPLTI